MVGVEETKVVIKRRALAKQFSHNYSSSSSSNNNNNNNNNVLPSVVKIPRAKKLLEWLSVSFIGKSIRQKKRCKKLNHTNAIYKSTDVAVEVIPNIKNNNNYHYFSIGLSLLNDICC